MTQPLERLLELMIHPDPALRMQGDEILKALPQEACQQAFLLALEHGDSALTIRIIGGTEPVLVGWMRRRAWATAAARLSETYDAMGHALPGQCAPLLQTLQDTLAGPATAARRVRVGGLRQAIIAALQKHHSAAHVGPWLTPAEVLFRDLVPSDTGAGRALEISAAALSNHLHRRSLRVLRPWSEMDRLVAHITELTLLQLPGHPDVIAGAQRQLLLRQDHAAMKTQRQLCHGLEQQQRALGSTMLTARAQLLGRWWRDTLRQLGACPESWLFSR